MTRIVIARHGNTFGPGDTVVRAGARTDLALVEKGRAQADALGLALSAAGFAPVQAYCSVLQRTRETATRALAAMGVDCELTVAPFLTEIDHGPDEGQPDEVVRARVGEAALAAWDAEAAPPAGWRVDPSAVTERWEAFFANEAKVRPGEDVLVVTSNGVARFALAAAKARPDGGIKLATGGYGVVELSDQGARVTAWNVRPAV